MTAGRAHADPRTRVLIAADHPAIRTSVRLALRKDAECLEAEDADAAVAVAVRDKPDVCVINLNPLAHGIRAAAVITSRVPGSSVVLMTRRLEADEFVAAVRAGATGYLSEQTDPARLPDVVRALMQGEAAVPRILVTRLIAELRGERRRHRLKPNGRESVELTPREWEVVESLRLGMTTRETAEHLGVASVTVRRHVSSVQKKLGFRGRGELLRLLTDTSASASRN